MINLLKRQEKKFKIVGTVGEPINPEAWMWYYKTVGTQDVQLLIRGGKLNWEFNFSSTRCYDLKPGSATKPFYGINQL